MKAMPLLLPGTITMKMPEGFDTVLAINSLALRQININGMYSFGHWMALSGGFMLLRRKDVQSPEQKNKN